MTTHYLDVTIRPDPEIATAHLMSALMERLHLALARGQRSDIGVSFPGYRLSPRTLGDTLRLHGTENGLQTLQFEGALGPLGDHVRLSPIRAAPENAPRVLVRRRQVKSSAERLRRRRIRRHGETPEVAAAAIPQTVERVSLLPSVQLRSTSTGQRHPVCIEQREAMEPRSARAAFNTYGLSAEQTVPRF